MLKSIKSLFCNHNYEVLSKELFHRIILSFDKQSQSWVEYKKVDDGSIEIHQCILCSKIELKAFDSH
ncbi:MAG: hypothetical protein IT212_07800 [Bacteroidia bacterium]|nr:hypothetical protein [Bacteroidia bacterium]